MLSGESCSPKLCAPTGQYGSVHTSTGFLTSTACRHSACWCSWLMGAGAAQLIDTGDGTRMHAMMWPPTLVPPSHGEGLTEAHVKLSRREGCMTTRFWCKDGPPAVSGESCPCRGRCGGEVVWAPVRLIAIFQHEHFGSTSASWHAVRLQNVPMDAMEKAVICHTWDADGARRAAPQPARPLPLQGQA